MLLLTTVFPTRASGLQPGRWRKRYQIDAAATREEKAALARLTAEDLALRELAGQPVTAILTTAPGDGKPIGGIKVITEHGWFAARPSGTEEVYKLYAESWKRASHLRQIQDEAQAVITRAFRSAARR